MKSLFYLETLLGKLFEAKQPFTLPTVGLLVPQADNPSGWVIDPENEGISFTELGETLRLIEPDRGATALKDLQDLLKSMEPGETFPLTEIACLQKTDSGWTLVPIAEAVPEEDEGEETGYTGLGFWGKIRSEWVVAAWLLIGFGTVLGALYHESRLAYSDLKIAIPVDAVEAILPDNTDYQNTSLVDSAWKMEDTIPAEGNLESLNVPEKIPPKPAVISPKHYEVVVGSYQTASQANIGMKHWADQGFEAHILFPEGAKETTFRVSVFTSPNLEQADSLKNILRPKVDAWVLLRK